jgi:hypothetical protein
MNSLELKVLWMDSDEMLQVGIKASSELHATYHEAYVYPESLKAFADQLKAFPQTGRAEAILESGSKDPKFYGSLRLRVFCLKPTGQSAMEVESEVRAAPPLFAKGHFYIPGMPADFNRMGHSIASWLEKPDDLLHVEWSNG